MMSVDVTASVSAEGPRSIDDDGYEELLTKSRERFEKTIAAGPLFTTDAEGLFATYLAALPPEHRQHYTCHACRRFFERYGGLVTIDENGRTTPAIWHEDDATGYMRPAVEAVARAVRRAKVTGIFRSSDPTWGEPKSRTVTRTWHHFAATPPKSALWKSVTQTAGQHMAEKREDFSTVMRALEDFTTPMIEQALTLLRTESLYRSEKVIGPAEWLLNVRNARDAAHGPARANVVWRAVATAPAGFTHPRSSMIGTLLEDIASGMDFGDVSRRFAAKMHPLQYQRPQAPPSAGAIAQAEKVVSQLGAAGALARRFARLEDIAEALWRPRVVVPPTPAGGVFGHLAPKPAKPAPHMSMPPLTMTWDKFAKVVLPSADRIEFYARNTRDSYTALCTAVNPESPPILQWDREDRRNPLSWYVWHGGSSPSEFSLAANAWHDVDVVTFKPSMWGDRPLSHQGEAVIFIVRGARDLRENAGAAIFPECLRSEFHGVRSVIEAYSRGAKLEGREEASACGLLLSKGGSWDARFRVTSNGVPVEYRLDRWD